MKGSAPLQGDRPVAPTGVWLFSCRSGGGLVVGLWMAMEDARWTMPLSYGTERVRRPYYGPAGIRASRGGGTLQARCP